MYSLFKNKYVTAIWILVLCIAIVFIASEVFAEDFKIKLNLFERLVCMALLPQEGSFVTLKIVRELQMELAPSEEEIALAGIKDDLLTGGVIAENGWLVVEEKEVIFGDIAKGLIVSALEKLDEAEKLTNDHFSLYEKFIIDKVEEKNE